MINTRINSSSIRFIHKIRTSYNVNIFIIKFKYLYLIIKSQILNSVI